MKIYRMNDRVRIKVKDVSFIVSPLNYAQKAEISGCITLQGSVQLEDTMKSLFLILKYSIKGLEGVENQDGKPYKLEMDGEVLSDECVNDILNLGVPELTIAAYQLLNGIPDKIMDPTTGKEIKAVKITYEGTGLKK